MFDFPHKKLKKPRFIFINNLIVLNKFNLHKTKKCIQNINNFYDFRQNQNFKRLKKYIYFSLRTVIQNYCFARHN